MSKMLELRTEGVDKIINLLNGSDVNVYTRRILGELVTLIDKMYRVHREEHLAFLKAINQEPELPGRMPDEIWDAVRNDRELTETMFREAIIQAKDGIRTRAGFTQKNIVQNVARSIQKAREMTGMGIDEIREGMHLAQTEDALLGACYIHAASLAVFIKDDRHQWNMTYATEMRDRLLSKETK